MALNTLPNAGLTSRGYPSDRLVTPLIINGDMSVAQRGTSATGLTNGSSGFHTVDRFRYSEAGAPSSQITMTQDTNVPTGQGFVTAMKFDVTTAQGSMSAADRVTFDQKIEAQNLQLLKYGTSNAEKLTLCFWVKATKTGTYVVWIYSPDGNRSVAKQYTMSASDTWEKKTINIPADTAGTINNDIGEGFRVSWFIAAGSNFTSGTLASSWESHTAANTAVGQVNATDSTSNNWHITGIQLEVGEFDSTSIPSFPFESFENNLSKCQRYYLHYLSGNNKLVGSGIAYSSNQANVPIHFPTTMRTSPSLDADTGTAYYRVLGSNSSGNGYVDDFNAFVIDRAHENATGLFINTSDGFSGTGGGGFYMVTENSSASIGFDAEI